MCIFLICHSCIQFYIIYLTLCFYTSFPINSQQAAAPPNQQFINTLILQISTHLQLLATLAPDKMKQIQLQILMSTLSPPQQAPPQGTNNPANLFANLQAALVNQQQLRNATGGLPAASNPGLQNLLSVAASQANGPVPLVANGSLGGVVAAPSGSNANPAPPLNQGPGLQHAVQQHVRRLSNASQASSVKSLKRKSPVVTAQVEPQKFKAAPAAVVVRPPQKKQSAVTVPTVSGNTMAEYLAKLRQGHAEALERARREHAEGDGPASKKQKQDGGSVNTAGNTSAGALLPFEHVTTISSGSGCTTNGSSSSSIENLPSSDATRNDSSNSSTGTSSNTMSEEDETEQEQQGSEEQELQDSESASARPPISKSSVPRKRFLSRRNLADHNVRMAEEMKYSQDQTPPPPNSNP